MKERCPDCQGREYQDGSDPYQQTRSFCVRCGRTGWIQHESPFEEYDAYWDALVAAGPSSEDEDPPPLSVEEPPRPETWEFDRPQRDYREETYS